MSKTPFFSILTATLNSHDTLSDNIESIESQDYSSFEHIVVDGDSGDLTIELLKEKSTHYNLKWISEADSGISSALNKAITMASGKYYVVIHADDTFLNTNILSIVESIINSEEYDIYSFSVYLDKNGILGLLRPKRLLWYRRFKTIILHQGAFVHRRVFEKIGGFNTDFKIALDYDFFYRALNAGATVKFIDFPVAVMKNGGLSSRLDLTCLRLSEEFRVQNYNENNILWRILQRCYRMLYLPYKLLILPAIHESLKKISNSRILK